MSQPFIIFDKSTIAAQGKAMLNAFRHEHGRLNPIADGSTRQAYGCRDTGISRMPLLRCALSIVAFSTATTVFNLHYRGPLDPILCIFAAYGLLCLFQRWQASHRKAAA